MRPLLVLELTEHSTGVVRVCLRDRYYDPVVGYLKKNVSGNGPHTLQLRNGPLVWDRERVKISAQAYDERVVIQLVVSPSSEPRAA